MADRAEFEDKRMDGNGYIGMGTDYKGWGPRAGTGHGSGLGNRQATNGMSEYRVVDEDGWRVSDKPRL